MVEVKVTVAQKFLKTWYKGQEDNEEDNKEKLTLGKFVTQYSSVFSTMQVVITAFKHVLTFEASVCIAMWENSFSTLKNVYTDYRRSVHGKPIKPIWSSWHLRMTSVGNSKMRRYCWWGSTRQQTENCNSTAGKSWLFRYLYWCYCLHFWLQCGQHCHSCGCHVGNVRSVRCDLWNMVIYSSWMTWLVSSFWLASVFGISSV